MPDPIVMVQTFAELRYGVVLHMRENSVKYGMGTIFFTITKQTLYMDKWRALYG